MDSRLSLPDDSSVVESRVLIDSLSLDRTVAMGVCSLSLSWWAMGVCSLLLSEWAKSSGRRGSGVPTTWHS